MSRNACILHTRFECWSEVDVYDITKLALWLGGAGFREQKDVSEAAPLMGSNDRHDLGDIDEHNSACNRNFQLWILGDNRKSRGQAVLFGIRFENWRYWRSRTPGWAAVVMETQTWFLGHHVVLVQLRVAEEHRPLAIGCVYRGRISQTRRILSILRLGFAVQRPLSIRAGRLINLSTTELRHTISTTVFRWYEREQLSGLYLICYTDHREIIPALT